MIVALGLLATAVASCIGLLILQAGQQLPPPFQSLHLRETCQSQFLSIKTSLLQVGGQQERIIFIPHPPPGLTGDSR